MEETLKLILTELKELKEGQQKLNEGQLELNFKQIENLIDEKTAQLKETIEDQQMVIDTLAARSVRHESEIKDFKRILKNQ